ncbi:hypothetical protein [Micromonospora kangleipakensis]|uniref:hypothetical protein n=1 Tax=Micromonospora kangleipakensis TaxID=1077942 RepID=UPI0013EF1877|nr:hypothetical protein [Micromonospora kangleipakensis]
MADPGAAETAAARPWLGYRRPFDDDWAEQVVNDVRELTGLFRAAAAAREAVILKIVA